MAINRYYSNNLQVFLKRKNEINKLKAQIKGLKKNSADFNMDYNGVIGQIATLQHENVYDIIKAAKDTQIFKSTSYKPTIRGGVNPNVKKAYSDLAVGNFFKAIQDRTMPFTVRKNTPTKFLKDIIELNKSDNISFTNTPGSYRSQSFESAMKSVKRAVSMKNGKAQGTRHGLFLSYDLETLGGKDAYGAQELLGITELGAHLFDRTGKEHGLTYNGISLPTLNNVIGLTDKQYESWQERLKTIGSKITTKDKNNPLTDSERVSLSRWAKIGSDKSTLEQVNGKGLIDGEVWKFANFADEGDLPHTDEELLALANEGIKKYRDVVGVSQENAAKKRGYYLYEKQMQALVDLASNRLGGVDIPDYMMSKKAGIISAGYNSLAFDNPVLRMMISSGAIKSAPLDIKPNTHVDMYDAVRFVAQDNDMNMFVRGHFDELTEGMGTTAQDTLRKVFYSNDIEGAHAAAMDADVIRLMFTKEINIGGESTTMLNFVHDKMKDMSEKYKNTVGKNGKYLGKFKQLFYLPQTMNLYGSGTNTKYGMDFEIDPVDRAIRFANNVNVYENGKTKENFMHQGLPKKNSLYTMNIFKAKPTDDFTKILSKAGVTDTDGIGINVDEVQKAMQEYGSDELYFMVMNPVYDKERMKRMGVPYDAPIRKSYVAIRTSKDEIEGLLSNFVEVGRNPNRVTKKTDVRSTGAYKMLPGINKTFDFKYVVKTAGKNGGEHFGFKNVLNGDKEDVNDRILMDILSQNTIEQAENEPAANFMRTLNFNKIGRMNRVIQQMFTPEGYEEFKASPTNKKISMMTENIRKVSEAVSQGKPLTLEYQKALNLGDMSSSNVLNNMLFSYKDYISLEPMINDVTGLIESSPKISNLPDERSRKETMDYAFKNIVNNLMVDLIGKNPAKANEILNRKNRAIDVNSLNYVELPVNVLLNSKQASTKTSASLDDEGELERVYLQNGKALMKRLMPEFQGQDADKKRQNAAIGALDNFYRRLIKSDGYSGFRFDLSNEDRKNLSQNNTAYYNEFLRQLKDYVTTKRGRNPVFGLSKESIYQYVLGGNSTAGKLYEENRDEMKKRIEAYIENDIPAIQVINGKNSGNLPQVLLSKMIGTSRRDYEKQVLGAVGDKSSDKYKYAMAMYDKANEDMAARANDIAGAVSKSDLSMIFYNNEANDIAVEYGGAKTPLNLPKLEARNGVLYTNVNKNRNLVQFVLDTVHSGGSPEKVGLKTTIAGSSFVGPHASDSVSAGAAIQNALKKGSNQAEALIGAVSNLNQGLLTTSPRIEQFNGQVFQESMQVNVNNMMSMLPELAGNKFVQQYINEFGPEEAEQFENLIDRIKKIKESHPDLNFSNLEDYLPDFEGTIASQRGPFMAHKLFPMLQAIAASSGDPTVKFILSNLTSELKDTNINQGYVSFQSGNADAFSEIGGNQIRPLRFQRMNSVLYNIDDIKNALTSKYLRDDAYVGNAVVDNTSKRLKSAGLTDSVTSKIALLSNRSYKDIVVDEYEKSGDNEFVKEAKELGFKDDEAAQFAGKLFDRAKQISLYDQEALVDTRFSEKVFNYSNVQKISANKNIMIMHNNELRTIKELEQMSTKVMFDLDDDGNIVFKAGRAVNENDYLLSTNNAYNIENTYVAKNSGMFRFGFFDVGTGNLVNSEKINNFAKSDKNIQAIIADATMNKEQKRYKIYNYLSKHYDPYFYIDKTIKTGLPKMYIGTSEKSVVQEPLLALGTTKNVQEMLKTLPAGDELTQYAGKIVENNKWNNEVVPLIEKRFGEKGVRAFENERNAISDVIFRRIEPIRKTGAHYIANPNTTKHGSADIALQNIGNVLREKGFIDKKYESELKNIFGNDITLDYANKSISLGDKVSNREYNIEALKGLLAKGGMDLGNLGNTISYKGSSVGSVVSAPIEQIYDNPGGTSADDNLLVGIQNKINTEKQYISGYKKRLSGLGGGHLSTVDRATKNSLNILIARHEAEEEEQYGMLSAIRNKNRGLKYSGRSKELLSHTRFNDEMLDLMYQNGMSDEEIQNIAGSYIEKGQDGKYKFKQGLKGESILKPYVDRMDNYLLYGGSDENGHRIKDITKGSPLEEQKLAKYFSYDKNIPVDKAKLMYAVGQGMNAESFNNMSGAEKEKQLSAMAHSGFKKFDISDVTYAQSGYSKGAFDKANNIYENMVVDLGADFGENRYLAVPKGISSTKGDLVIKGDYLKYIPRLQTLTENYRNASAEERGKIKPRILNTIEQYKQQMNQDFLSSQGYAGALEEVRMPKSHLGKVTGLVIDRGGLTPEEWQNASKEERLGILKRYNPSQLENAQFEGKSLLENYAEDTILDTQFRSEKAFEKMGYFSPDMMQRVISNASGNTKIKEQMLKRGLKLNYAENSPKQNKEIMEELLRTYGDIVTTTRFPEIMEGSTMPSLMYLNNDLDENAVQILGSTAAAMKADYDGDEVFASLMLDKYNQSFLSNAVKAKVKPKISNANDMIDREKFYMMNRAIGANHYFENKVQGDIAKEVGRAVQSGDLLKTAETDIIGGKLHSSINQKDFSMQELRNIENTISPIVSSARKAANLPAYTNYDKPEEVVGLNNAVVSYIHKNYSNPDEAEKLVSYYRIQSAKNKLVTSQAAQSLKGSIGEANRMSYKLRKVFENTANTKAEDFNLRGDILQEIVNEGEESVISGKNLKGKFNEKRASDWNKILGGIFSGNTYRAHQKINELPAWLSDENVKGRIIEKADLIAAKHPAFKKQIEKSIAGETDEKVIQNKKFDLMVNSFTNTMREISDHSEVNKLMPVMDFGDAMFFSGNKLKNLTSIEGFDTLEQSLLGNIMKSGVVNKEVLNIPTENINDVRLSNSSHVFRNMRKVVFDNTLPKENDTVSMIKDTAKSIGSEISKGAQDIGAKNLALGALGIAAAYMSIGIMGGNPSKPAQNHAEDEAGDEQYSSPNLSDEGQQGEGSERNQAGYVININANTAKGKKQVSQALNKAMSQSIPTDVNISMNIKDTKGNISSSYIDKLIAGAI